MIDYSYMDEWDSAEVASFKEEAEEMQLSQVNTKMGLFGFHSQRPKIVAEGDSWFDYSPGTDLIDCLKKHHRHHIKNYAKGGDTLENMIYGTEHNSDFQRTVPTIDIVLRKIGQYKPKVFLFSGGGNDIAGDEFASYLNHKNSSLPSLRREYIDYMMNTVFKKYFQDLIAKVAAISPNTHIITHGYGHTVPTGEGVERFFITWAGPWLRPALAQKGIFDSNEQRSAVEYVMNTYNEMLLELNNLHENFHHLDLRDMIDPDNDWVNELHLKNSAYARVADRFNSKIVELQNS